MKKVSLMIAALALVLGLSQCRKEDKPLQNGEKQHVVLTASNGNDGSKVIGIFNSNELQLKWEGIENENITVSGGAEGTLYYVSGAGRTIATFEGNITKGSGDVVFTIGSAPSSYEGQLGTKEGCEAWIKDNNHFVGRSPWVEDGKYDVTMELQYAVLKLDLSALGTETGNTVSISDGTSVVASVKDVTKDSKEVYVAVPADGTPLTYSIEGNSYGALEPWTLEPNTFYTKAGAKDPTGEAFVIESTYINFNDDAMSVSDLPKWALKNIGATNGSTAQSWYGDYYAWGETEPYYTSINWTSATSGTVAGWCEHPSHNSDITFDPTVGYYWKNYGDGEHESWPSGYEWNPVPYDVVTLKEAYDVARKKLGSPWHMPEHCDVDDWGQLQSNTFWVWRTDYNGITGLNGYIVYKVKDVADKGKKDNPESSKIYSMSDPHMFLPAAGRCYETALSRQGTNGYYWTTRHNNSSMANYKSFKSDKINETSGSARCVGVTVRPVW